MYQDIPELNNQFKCKQHIENDSKDLAIGQMSTQGSITDMDSTVESENNRRRFKVISKTKLHLYIIYFMVPYNLNVAILFPPMIPSP